MILDKLTQDEIRSALIGTILADSSLTKNRKKACRAYLDVTHTAKALDYLKLKQALLARLEIESKITRHDKQTDEKTYMLFRLSSRTDDWLTHMRDIIYDKDFVKTFPKELLSMMNSLSLLLLYLDDGTLKIRHYEGTDRIREIRSTFCLDRFTVDEVNNFMSWLKKEYGIESKKYRHSKNMSENRGFRCWMNTTNTKKLMDVLDEFYELVPSMKYKFVKYYSM